MATYGWIVTRDELDNERVSVVGPRDIPEELERELLAGNGDTFRMYDDDGELYYTGRGMTLTEWDEDACYGPLGDYGMPNAGAVDIRWQGHPERDCG